VINDISRTIVCLKHLNLLLEQPAGTLHLRQICSFDVWHMYRSIKTACL